MALAKSLIPFEVCIALCPSFLTPAVHYDFEGVSRNARSFIFVLIRSKPSDEAWGREGELPPGPRGGIKVSSMA